MSKTNKEKIEVMEKTETVETVESKSKSKSEFFYIFTEEGREVLDKLLKNESYNKVFNIFGLMDSKKELDENEVNFILNKLGEFPYVKIHEFFNNVNKYIEIKK